MIKTFHLHGTIKIAVFIICFLRVAEDERVKWVSIFTATMVNRLEEVQVPLTVITLGRPKRSVSLFAPE